MVDFAGAIQAIEDRLTSMWTETAIAFEDGISPVAVDSDGMLQPWVLCEVATTSVGIKSIGTPGDHVTVEEGIITLTLFSRRGSDRQLRREMAARLAEVFRTAVFYQISDGVYVRTWTPETGAGNPASSENPSGSWWAINVLTPFEFYHRA